MELTILNGDYTVCKIQDTTGVDFGQTFVFVSKTDDEISLVCETRWVPQNTIKVENDWKVLKIVGILDFGMVGVIAQISTLLAKAKISIFVVSTFNTDYVLVKSEALSCSIEILRENGYSVVESTNVRIE